MNKQYNIAYFTMSSNCAYLILLKSNMFSLRKQAYHIS